MIKTITSSSKTQSHQPTGSSQSFDNCQFIDRSTANYQQIIDSNQPNFLSNFNDISIPYLNTSSTGVFTPGPVGTVIGLQNKPFTGQHLQDKSFQTAAVGKPRHGDEVHGMQAKQQKYSQHLMHDQGTKRNKVEQNQSEVSDLNQIKALRNLISSMQSPGANDYNQHPLPLKNVLPKSSVLSDTGNCGLREPQGVYKDGYITSDVFYSDLSKLTNSRSSDYNSVTFTSSQQCNDNALINNLNCMSSSLHQSNFNSVTSIYQSHQDYLSFSNTSKCFTPSSNEQTIHNLDSYQAKKQGPIVPYLNGGLQHSQVLQDSQTSSYLQELVDQSTPIDINSTLKQLINQLNQNPHSSKSSNNLQEQQTINEQGIANFQARNENQQQLKNHILRNLSHKNQKKQVSLKCPQSDYEKNEHIRKRDAKQNLKKINDNQSDDSMHNSIKQSKIIDDKIQKLQKRNVLNETDNEQIKKLTDKNIKEDNKMLYDLIEHKNTKRNSNISQLTCQNNNNVSKQKYQMVDKSSELKKRRLQLSSFRQNPTFHTSGNRFVPTMPKSILGAPIKTENNQSIQI